MNFIDFGLGLLAGAILPTLFLVLRRRWELTDRQRALRQQHIQTIHALVTRLSHQYFLHGSIEHLKATIEELTAGVRPEDAPTHPNRDKVLTLTGQMRKEADLYMSLNTQELGEHGKWALSFKYLDEPELTEAWEHHWQIWNEDPTNLRELQRALDKMLEILATMQRD